MCYPGQSNLSRVTAFLTRLHMYPVSRSLNINVKKIAFGNNNNKKKNGLENGSLSFTETLHKQSCILQHCLRPLAYTLWVLGSLATHRVPGGESIKDVQADVRLCWAHTCNVVGHVVSLLI